LPYNTRHREAEVVAHVLQKNAKRKRGGVAIGALLPAVLARLGASTTESETTETETHKSEARDRS
jgi:hypothetical protein